MYTVRKTLMLVAGIAFLLGMSILSAAAASPADSATDNPALATYIDGASHSIAANSAQWYKFDYNSTRNDDGSRNPVTVTVAELTSPNIGFEVYTPDQMATWYDNDPIGRGSQVNNLCGQIDDDWVYTCQAYSLTWTGKFNANGTFYVRVTNDNPYAVNVTLTEQE